MTFKKGFIVCLSIIFWLAGFTSCAFPEKNGGREQSEEEEGSQENSSSEKKYNTYSVDWQIVEIPAPSLSDSLIQEPDRRTISVLLPESYDENEDAYPVLYFLNGYGSPHENAAAGLLDAMMALSLEKLIIVSVDAINQLNCSFYVNSPVTGGWQDFVAEDVVEYIDSNYRTIRNAYGRGLAGHSVGGFGVLNIALNTEGIFDYVYAMSPAVFAPEGFTDYGLSLEPVTISMQEYEDLSVQEAAGRYLLQLGDEYWQPRYGFDYGSAFVPDENGKAPYILLPERADNGGYMRDSIWEQYQDGFGGPPQLLEENRDRLLKLGGLVLEYGRQDELIWLRDGCIYLDQQLKECDIPFDLRVYDGGHSSEVPKRFISDVLPYFAEHLSNQPVSEPE